MLGPNRPFPRLIVNSSIPTSHFPRENRSTVVLHGLKPTRPARARRRDPDERSDPHDRRTDPGGGAAWRRASVSKATVYNTLKVLAQRGLVRQINLDPERSVYDSTRAPHHHFHVWKPVSCVTSTRGHRIQPLPRPARRHGSRGSRSGHSTAQEAIEGRRLRG